MRAPAVIAASLALVTVAAAEQPEVDRPRFYFPKHVKRVVSDGSPASPASPVSPNRRELPAGLGDLFNDLTGGGDPFGLLPSGSGGLLPPVVVQPTPTKKSSTSKHTTTSKKTSEKTTPSSAITFGPGGVVSSSSKTTPAPSSSTDDGLLGALGLGGLFGPGTGSTTSTAKPKSTSSTGDGGLLGITIPPLLGTPTATGTGVPSSTSTPGGLLSGLLPPPPSSSTGLGSILSSIIGTGTSTGPASAPTNGTTTGTATGFPTTQGSNGTTTATVPPTNGTISTSSLFTSPTGFTGTGIGSTNATATITKPSHLPPPSTTATLTTPTVKPPQSIVPTGTNTATSWLPASVIVAPSASLVTGGASPTGSGAPKVPQVISPPNGPAPGIPAGSRQIQIGFLFPLNYQFVVSNAVSSAQIYEWLPQGVSYGLGIKPEDVVIQSLVPLDTTERLGYITTIAMGYIPGSMFNTLNLDLHIPTSELYNNPDESVNTLMNFIDPSIPLTPGLGLPGSEGTGPGAQPTTQPNTGILNPAPQQKQSNSAMKSTAGIATGVVGAAAAYGAAMFFVARRYKKRRQSHRRSSSTSTFGGPEMVQAGSPALMGGSPVNPFMAGGRLSPEASHGPDRNSRGSGNSGSSGSNSARTQQISGPMMAENSLGWN